MRAFLTFLRGPTLVSRVLRYGLSGAASATTYVASGVLLHHLGCSPVVAPYIAYLCGFAVSYTLHATFTFQSRTSLRSLIPVFVASLIGIVLSSIVVSGLMARGMAPIFAYGAGVGVNAAIGFTTYSLIFRGRRAFTS